jgi:hypothetical protein
MIVGVGERSSRAESVIRGFAGPALLALPAQPNHMVQFYDTEDVLITSVTSFLATGLSLGEGIVIVATRNHRANIEAALVRKGFSLAAAESAGQCIVLDAEETLAKILVDGLPDWDRFHAIADPALASITGRDDPRPVRAFGEMVDVLWQAGNATAAVQLEGMWNRLAGEHRFSLLCAYAMGALYQRVGEHSIDDILCTHSHVIPSPSYARLRAEVTHRKNVERALRDALRELHAVQKTLTQFVNQRSGGRQIDATAGSEDGLAAGEIKTLALQLLNHPDETVVAFAQRVLESTAVSPTRPEGRSISSRPPAFRRL